MDSGDKASNKAMAVAFKYACFQVFCIPTEDMPDPDNETPPPSKPMNGKPPENGKPETNEVEKEKIGKLIGEILETRNPEGLPYFREQEIAMERENYMSGDLQSVIKQHEKLQKYLEARKGANNGK